MSTQNAKTQESARESLIAGGFATPACEHSSTLGGADLRGWDRVCHECLHSFVMRAGGRASVDAIFGNNSWSLLGILRAGLRLENTGRAKFHWIGVGPSATRELEVFPVKTSESEESARETLIPDHFGGSR